MTLPAVIVLSQVGLAPALELVDDLARPPIQPEYISWLTAEQNARIAGDTTNAAAIAALQKQVNYRPSYRFNDPRNAIYS